MMYFSIIFFVISLLIAIFAVVNSVHSMMRTHDYCIILAGGQGRRLWPVSRAQHPKQFIDFFGVGRTLLQLTFDRISRFIPIENIYVSTFVDYVPLVKTQLPELKADQILAEPAQLSTAPAAAWGSWYIGQRDAKACIVASPADQFITNEMVFKQELEQGLDYVRQHPQFLAMSVKASTPNTAYGYLQKGQTIDDCRFTRKSFTEKPPIDFAKTFVESGEFLWNTGLFLWHVQTMAPHVSELLPGIGLSAVQLTAEEAQTALARYYPAAEYASIDSALLDRDWPTVVQECSFGWRDVGSWPVMKEVHNTDGDGNAAVGGAGVIFQGTRRTLVHLPQGVGAVVRGLDGFVVALEGNMLMITPTDEPAHTRQLANTAQLKLGQEFG